MNSRWTSSSLDHLRQLRVSAEIEAGRVGIPSHFARLPRNYQYLDCVMAAGLDSAAPLLVAIQSDFVKYKTEWEDSNRAVSALADSPIVVYCRALWSSASPDEFSETLSNLLNELEGKRQFEPFLPSLLNLDYAVHNRGGGGILPHEAAFAEMVCRSILTVWYLSGVSDE